MIDFLSTPLIAVPLVAAVWSAVLVVLGRPLLPGKRDGLALLGLLLVIEIGLLVQAVAGFVAMPGAAEGVDLVSYGGYLLGVLVILPLATAWALAERSRWGPSVLIVGCLAVPVMIVRLEQIWTGHG